MPTIVSILTTIGTTTQKSCQWRKVTKRYEMRKDEVFAKSLQHPFSIILLSEFDGGQLDESSYMTAEALR